MITSRRRYICVIIIQVLFETFLKKRQTGCSSDERITLLKATSLWKKNKLNDIRGDEDNIIKIVLNLFHYVHKKQTNKTVTPGHITVVCPR